jgi:hypothetical protein
MMNVDKLAIFLFGMVTSNTMFAILFYIGYIEVAK